jgi:hypothetical protein
MRTRSRSRLGWAAAGALAFVVGAPAASQAQQSGLFPLSPIRRERTPCPMEDPLYKLYRQQYFGYHPTCWRRFPAGWGCPSPEAPNPALEFQRLKRDTPGGSEPGPDPAAPAPGDGTPAPGGEMPAPPAGGNAPAPGGLPPLPSNERSPFDLDNKPAPLPAPAPAPPGGGRPTTDDPKEGQGLGLRGAAPEAEPVAPVSAGNSEPLLALPDPTAGAPISVAAPTSMPAPASSPGQVQGFPVADPGASASVIPGQAPAQAPRRQGLLGSLFSGLRRR